MPKYYVTLDVFFMEHHEVEAQNEEEAFEEARKKVCHGMGEEITLYDIEKTED